MPKKWNDLTYLIEIDKAELEKKSKLKSNRNSNEFTIISMFSFFSELGALPLNDQTESK